MPSATESMALALTGETEKTDKQIIAEALAQMNHAIDDGNNAADHAFNAAIALGYHADIAKAAMPKADFAPWLEKNFGEKSKRPQSPQWVYKCMNAARAFALLPKGERKRSAILAQFGTVKKLAGILGTLENGDNPLETEAPAPAVKRGAPTKAERAAKAAKLARAAKQDDADTDTGTGANELAAESAKLARLAKVLDAKEKRLNQFEEALNERERLLVIREAALPAGVTDATAKDVSADKGEKSLEAARAKARAPRKAPASPASAPVSAAKPKGKGKGAKTPEIAPETAAAIKDAAERAVKSDADKAMDQPHHGHGQEEQGEQPGGAY